MTSFLDSLLGTAGPAAGIVGVASATVVDNLDAQGLGRVQLSFAWQPDLEPWARVATLAAGPDCGTWWVPQVDDEVLVAFEQGDVLQPYVIGALWNGTDGPPADAPNDATDRRILKTPAGHVLELDDPQQTVTLTSSTGQTVTLGPDGIELSAGDGKAVATLSTTGTLKIEASVKLELKAPTVTISATTLELSADASATLKAGASCTVQGSLVRIN